MDAEEERAYEETAAQLLQEVSLPLAAEAQNEAAINVLPTSLATPGPSVITSVS